MSAWGIVAMIFCAFDILSVASFWTSFWKLCGTLRFSDSALALVGLHELCMA